MLHLDMHEAQRQMLDMRIKVIRPSERAEGCRVDVHAFYYQQQLSELKRLAVEYPRPARNTIYYSRAKRYPRLPARRQDLRLTSEQTTTKSGAQFLMYHSPTNDILIFATEAGARLLVQSNCWCVDGTFKIVPSWYQQLFTLNVFMKGKLLPCSIPKAEKLGFQVDPAKFVCDFQTALILAIQDNFPNNQVQGFFFYKSADHKLRKHHLGFYQLLQLIIDEQGKTETVVRQMDDGYTRGRDSVRLRSPAAKGSCTYG
ncbi:hypothetical protein T4B_9554 [Trichinella pseudospiralis]|uniref:MULE transposase domain-containing protein n=1 Tax=Trichinella pseudospiralis TaxID=6337 RepID=A0A0V1H591_TRIPS|nr:hypothetical protein T4B_1875 [Trichinella pseudospiralis]KRZ08692.1 hypothetical protein T4B_9554 [Trichinella pseudospiralis]